MPSEKTREKEREEWGRNGGIEKSEAKNGVFYRTREAKRETNYGSVSYQKGEEEKRG